MQEQHLLESGQLLRTHGRLNCIGEWCAIHQPMPGPWTRWPRYWDSYQERVVRICPCGCEHPVAEMYVMAILARSGFRSVAHQCCGIHPCTPIDGGTEWMSGYFPELMS